MLQSTIWWKSNNQVVIPLVPFFPFSIIIPSLSERLREKIQFGFSVLLPRGNESVVQSAYTIKSTENQLKPTNTIEIFQQILFEPFLQILLWNKYTFYFKEYYSRCWSISLYYQIHWNPIEINKSLFSSIKPLSCVRFISLRPILMEFFSIYKIKMLFLIRNFF